MIYITGDKHRDFSDILDFCLIKKPTKKDIMIILGDAGINYYLDESDKEVKKAVSNLPITLFCIHGNHEERPENIPTYKEIAFNSGLAYCEEAYPNLIFAKDGEIYNFNNLSTLVIGGAYSIDKEYRLRIGATWFPSEQPSTETKEKVRQVLKDNNNQIDVILSHTVPYKYMPTEMLLSWVDQSTVDKSTELFLDEIEENTDYKKWYCGHFHTDKEIDKIRFMMYDIATFGKDIKRKTRKK